MPARDLTVSTHLIILDCLNVIPVALICRPHADHDAACARRHLGINSYFSGSCKDIDMTRTRLGSTE